MVSYRPIRKLGLADARLQHPPSAADGSDRARRSAFASQQGFDGEVPLRYHLLNDRSTAGIGRSRIGQLHDVDLVEVAYQGRNPARRVAPARWYRRTRRLLCAALVVGQ